MAEYQDGTPKLLIVAIDHVVKMLLQMGIATRAHIKL
jgi:hypothetical protein